MYEPPKPIGRLHSTDGSEVARLIGVVKGAGSPAWTRRRALHLPRILPALQKVMSEDYQLLLVKATTATNRTESIGILAKILANDSGKNFVSHLDRKDGESCIEILDHVSATQPWFILI